MQRELGSGAFWARWGQLCAHLHLPPEIGGAGAMHRDVLGAWPGAAQMSRPPPRADSAHANRPKGLKKNR